MKRAFILAVIAAVFIPSVVSAAWWNPLSWFDFFFKPKVEVIVPTQVIQPVIALETATSTTSATTTPKEVIKKPKPVVKSQPIIKTQPVIEIPPPVPVAPTTTPVEPPKPQPLTIEELNAKNKAEVDAILKQNKREAFARAEQALREKLQIVLNTRFTDPTPTDYAEIDQLIQIYAAYYKQAGVLFKYSRTLDGVKLLHKNFEMFAENARYVLDFLQ